MERVIAPDRETALVPDQSVLMHVDKMVREHLIQHSDFVGEHSMTNASVYQITAIGFHFDRVSRFDRRELK